MKLKKLLFLCTGNSCRSHLGEAIVNQFYRDQWHAYSAGTEPAGYIHPLAIRALAEIGIAHTGSSKHLDLLNQIQFDLVITVCDDAADNCPIWIKSGKVIHMPFPDPAKTTGTEDQKYQSFIKVRDGLKSKLKLLLPNQIK